MVRSYRKYEPTRAFGTVASSSSNCVWTPDPVTSSTARATGSGRVYTASNEDVLCWDVKKGDLLSRWHDRDNRSEVTCISKCSIQPDLFAVGYADGSIRIWDALSAQIVVSFNGHRSAVTHLRFDRDGSRLASGSRDTDIIVWNLLSESAEFRLRGHKDQITGLEFLSTNVSRRQSPHTDEAVDVGPGSEGEEELEERYMLSTSKDALIKIWDLKSPHCVETHVAQSNGECWALGISADGAGCITAGNDGELKIWSLDLDALSMLDYGYDGQKTQLVLNGQGSLQRQNRDRTTAITFHPKQDYIAVHGSEKAVEIWRVRPTEEVQRHIQRKRRRRREKAAAAGETLQPDAEDAVGAAEVSDVFVPHVIVRTGGKVRSIDWISSGSRTSKALQLVAATTNNQVELYSVNSHRAQQKLSNKDAADYSRSLAVDIPGHRSDIRALALSSDDRMVASASSGQLKVWNVKTVSCLRTLDCGQALCSAFLPGDRIVVLGTKSGEIELYDISTSSLIESFRAHEGPIWTLAVHPDGKSMATGSADKSVKFWRFDIVNEDIPGTRRTTQRLKLTQTRQLKVADDILSLTFSPDERLLALSTLDNTVKIFFTDSLKLFLTLYGHKLPVLNVSISTDSKLIATCSADKNIRIWGLDFGDCHKALFAHQDSIMQVSFIPHPIEQDERHILISASKDGVIKTWDGDKFEQVQKLEGHKGEIWALAVSRTGELLISASHDKSIRTWEIGDDLIFLEEEREKELEEMYESTLAHNLARDADAESEGPGDSSGDNNNNEVGHASKQTLSTLTHGEQILEALDLCLADLALVTQHERQHPPPSSVPIQGRNPLFLALGSPSAQDHLLSILARIPPSALPSALLLLPFSALPALFTFLAIFLRDRTRPDLAWRIASFLLHAHMPQIVASSAVMRPLLDDVLRQYDAWQRPERELMGFNLAALRILAADARELEVGDARGFVDGEDDDDEQLGSGTAAAAAAASASKGSGGGKKRAFASLA